MEFLIWLENSGYATWMREADYLNSTFPYTFVLAQHAIGLAILVGPNTVLNLRILGMGSSLPVKPMEGFFPLMWVGFWINAISGVLLVPTSAVAFLTDPIFYIKLGAIALAIVILRSIHREVFGVGAASLGRVPLTAKAKALAGTSLALWTIAIVAGRLMAYSAPVRWATLGALLVLMVLAGIGWTGGALIARSPASTMRRSVRHGDVS